MGFLIFFPLGAKSPRDLTTSNAIDVQIWQELVMLRHLAKFSEAQSTAPWIDQAKTYFLDACKSNWRSGGLLYYYSFLNLAKAYLISQKAFSSEALNSTSVYHGLHSDPQSQISLADYKIAIHPVSYRQRQNVFSNFYQAVTGMSWPFSSPIEITLSSVLGYCEDIAAEILELLSLQRTSIHVQSLLRILNNEMWFEMVVPFYSVEMIKQYVSPLILNQEDTTWNDLHEWFLAFRRVRDSFSGHVILRGQKVAPTQNMSLLGVQLQITREVILAIEPYAFPTVIPLEFSPQWLFMPKLNMGGKELVWHPLLSDYLVAFALGTILRYQPQLLANDTPSSFIAEAWCNQSAISALRRFLMLFTAPPLRIDTH